MMTSDKRPTKAERPELFTIRSDQELWDALDLLQVSTKPVRNRSEIVRDLIFQARDDLKARRKRKKA